MRGRWGDIDVTDCADGVNHAIAQGWADPSRIVIMGGSAGGLTALHLLARFGDLFAGGIVLYPVTDLDALDATTHRYEKHYNATLVGTRTDALYADRSPITHVSRITKPLLILHGDADPVVTVDQSKAVADQLTGLGRDAQLVIYEGEGHGWRKPETRIDEINRIDTFLARFT
jgi:dipeptidyl aminopeptidase/acylaminoacyl peptidase